MVSGGKGAELEVFNTIVSSLASLDSDAQAHILQNVMNWFGVEIPGVVNLFPPRASAKKQAASEAAARPPDGRKEAIQSSPAMPGAERVPAEFSAREVMSPKDFLVDREPRTDIERVACLAYYLTHYRDTPHFRTLGLSKLNTEAAQPKLSNAARAVKNAMGRGLIVAAGRKGLRQLSVQGEQYVGALPDREAAKQVLERVRPRRTRRSAAKAKKGSPQEARSQP